MKQKLIKKYGREASPTIEKCVSKIMDKNMVKPQDFSLMEDEISIVIQPKYSPRLE